jgi:hypothetical protein
MVEGALLSGIIVYQKSTQKRKEKSHISSPIRKRGTSLIAFLQTIMELPLPSSLYERKPPEF